MLEQTSDVSQKVLIPPQFTPAEWSRIVTALQLTPRKANVAALVLQCRSDKEIAIDAGITEETVNSHLRGIYDRLEINGRVALVLRVFDTAKRLGTPPYPPNG